MSNHADGARVSRVEIIPFLHGKVTADGNVSEPDIYWILERWLERHPEIQPRRRDIQISRGRWTTHDGFQTEVIRATILRGDDIAGYDPAADADLYEFYLAEERYWQTD